MPPARKFPLSSTLLHKIRRQVNLHCEAFVSNTVSLHSIGNIPGSHALPESLHWPIREAFEYFQHLGVGYLDGDFFKVLDRGYFSIDPDQIKVSVSFSIDERLRSELPVMFDLYAQVYDVENRLRFFLHRKLFNKYGTFYVSHLPRHVRERIEVEHSLNRPYVIDPRRGDLEYTHLSDLRRIIDDNEEFILDNQSRSVLLERLGYLNSIRHLAAHNNLITPVEANRIRDNCEIVRLIIGEEPTSTAVSEGRPAEESIANQSDSLAQEAPAEGEVDVRPQQSHPDSAAVT